MVKLKVYTLKGFYGQCQNLLIERKEASGRLIKKNNLSFYFSFFSNLLIVTQKKNKQTDSQVILRIVTLFKKKNKIAYLHVLLLIN